MSYYIVPIDYTDIATEEKTVKLNMESTTLTISISPVPYTKKALITIVEDGEPLITNKVCSVNEFVLRYNSYSQKFVGDFKFFITTSQYGVFDIDRLGVDIFLYYLDGDGYEG